MKLQRIEKIRKKIAKAQQAATLAREFKRQSEIASCFEEWNDPLDDYLISNGDVKDEIDELNESIKANPEAWEEFNKEQGSKNDDGLIQFDAIPPLGEFELARAFSIGAKKYSNHNFRKGFKYGRLYSAMMRHAKKWLAGEQRDPKDGQHHLASVAWYALVLIEQEHRHPELDDRFKMDEEYIRKLHDMRS